MLEYINHTDQLREQVIQTRKMDAMEHLGAAISHEIRNPLTSAKGFLQLVQEKKELSQETRGYLQIASEELNQAEKVIQDYLTFAKPSLEEVVELDVYAELRYVINTVLPLANRHSVNIQKDFLPVPAIQGDRAKLRQCLFNVIKNGIEAMPSGGTLLLTTMSTERSTLITVQDSGMGMTKKQIARIGEPYYSTKEGNGTGLGLMVVKSILKAMKGQLEISSEIGVGTKMTLIFPSCQLEKKSVVHSEISREG